MAAVTQCDVCNSVVKNEESFYIELYSCDKAGNTTKRLISKDLCPTCKKKLLGMLRIEE